MWNIRILCFQGNWYGCDYLDLKGLNKKQKSLSFSICESLANCPLLSTSPAIQLKYIHVNTFNSYVPESFYPELQCVVGKGCYPRKAPFYRQLDMTTLGGHKFVSYAKYGRLNDGRFAGPELHCSKNADFMVKTWQLVSQNVTDINTVKTITLFFYEKKRQFFF